MLRLINFDGTRTDVNVDEKEIKLMIIVIVSGDEVAFVQYKDGSFEKFDSNGIRLMDFFDDLYVVEKKYLKAFNEAELNSIDAQARMEEFKRCKMNS